MYILVGKYTYSCYEPVEVGDQVVLPAPPWSGTPDISTVTAVDVGPPKDYHGPIKSVLKVIKTPKPKPKGYTGRLPTAEVADLRIRRPFGVLKMVKGKNDPQRFAVVLGEKNKIVTFFDAAEAQKLSDALNQAFADHFDY